jgi:hypothetical protein
VSAAPLTPRPTSARRRPPVRLLLAGLLGVGSALLVACGGSGSLIPADAASTLSSDIASVQSSANSGDCTDMQAALTSVVADYNSLPASVSPSLRSTLNMGITNLEHVAATRCAAAAAASSTAHSTSTATTTTSQTTTSTANTTTSTPSTTDTSSTSSTTPSTNTSATTSTATNTNGGTTVPTPPPASTNTSATTPTTEAGGAGAPAAAGSGTPPASDSSGAGQGGTG